MFNCKASAATAAAPLLCNSVSVKCRFNLLAFKAALTADVEHIKEKWYKILLDSTASVVQLVTRDFIQRCVSVGTGLLYLMLYKQK